MIGNFLQKKFGKASEPEFSNAVDVKGLLKRMEPLSKGDLSTLKASLDHPDSVMLTSPGSQNDILWSGLSEIGWMSRQEKSDMPVATLEYKILPVGVAPLSELVAVAIKQRIDQGEKMAALYKQNCPKLITQMVEPILGEGGSKSDVFATLSGIVAETLNILVAAEDRIVVLNKVSENAKTLLKTPPVN